MRDWTSVTNYLHQVTDALGNPIDEGIFETVVALNVVGIPTTQSCEGHLGYGLPYPWVDIASVVYIKDFLPQLKRREYDSLTLTELKEEAIRRNHAVAQRAMRYLSDFYEHRPVPDDRRIGLNSLGGYEAKRLCSRCSNLNLDLASQEEIARKLQEYQEEMQAFTRYLKLEHCQ